MEFSNTLIKWYLQNKRDLPWRNTQDPYFVWLSEIILQQTRVAQGLPYYQAFVAAFPTVHDLARAAEQDVLKLWQGLGYYSRARNLHQAAQYISTELNGEFPNNYQDLLQIKGIGTYTAAAVASFCYNEAVPVVDGNVFRVLARYLGVPTDIALASAKKEFYALAAELMPQHEPAIFNQALMEFGALQCVPANPNCEICPLVSQCLAFKNKTIAERPQKRGKIVPKNRYFHFVQFDDGENILLEKRIGKDIWQHLFQFPLIEYEQNTEFSEIEEQLVNRFEMRPTAVSSQIKHVLTHQKIYAYVWKFDSFPVKNRMDSAWLIVNKNDLFNYPIPRLLDRYLLGE